jgi:ribonuclease R
LKQYPYPIPSREEILTLLRKAPGRHDLHAIAGALGVKQKEMEGLMRRLTAMERDGQIRLDAGGRYQLLDTQGFILGHVSSHVDGYGFLIPDAGGEDVFLPENEMRKVLHGDHVKVRISGMDRRGRAEGTIVEVVSRANTHVIAGSTRTSLFRDRRARPRPVRLSVWS